MLKKVTLALFAFCVLLSQSNAQEVWSLEKCVQYALEHSLTLRQSNLNAQQSNIIESANKQLRLPNVSGSTNYNLSFGRQIDPVTNDFINQSFGNQNLSISAGVTLFNGGRISNQIRQAGLNREASLLDVEQMTNDISLDVASAYLQILFAIENLSNAQKSVDLVVSNLEQIDRMISAGTRPRNDRLDLVAQQSQNEQLVVTAQNNVDIAYLNLKQIMQLDQDYEMQVEVPDIPLPTEYDVLTLSASEVYDQAEAWQPQIRAGEIRKQSAELDVELARTNMIPTIGIGGSLGSNYSSFTRRQGDQIGTETITQDGFMLNGEPLNVSFEQPIFAFDKVSYIDQLNQNLGYGFGISLNVPIYNQGQSKANVKLAELDVARTQIQNLQTKDLLKTDIQRAVADLKAAKKQYDAALRTAEARRAVYQDTEKRFNLGVANSFEFTTAQNNRDQAEVDLIIAKYDYIFRSKVVDYYQGKRITLN